MEKDPGGKKKGRRHDGREFFKRLLTGKTVGKIAVAFLFAGIILAVVLPFTLKLIPERNSYTVTLPDGKGGTSKVSVESGTPFVPPDISKPGYDIAWFSGGKEIQPGDELPAGAKVVPEFTPKIYPVELVVEGQVYAAMAIVFDGWVAFPVPPAPEGMVFDGWYTGDQATGEKITGSSGVCKRWSYTDLTRLYANFRDYCVVDYDTDGKKHNPPPDSVTPGGKVTPPAELDDGSEIDWYDEDGNLYDPEKPVTGDKTLHGRVRRKETAAVTLVYPALPEDVYRLEPPPPPPKGKAAAVKTAAGFAELEQDREDVPARWRNGIGPL